MSYLGFIRPIFNSYVNKHCKNPRVLEIGIDRGQSTIPIIQNLIFSHDSFDFACVDIKVNHTFIEQVGQFSGLSVVGIDSPGKKELRVYEKNSLEILQKFIIHEEEKFDLVFIDGDHNYITVRQELDFVSNLIKKTGVIVCDDFNGRWAFNDLFYSERPGYENTKLMKREIFEDKFGVQPAVTDFVNANPLWSGWSSSEYEPIILYRNDVWSEFKSMSTPTGHLKDGIFQFNKIQEKP